MTDSKRKPWKRAPRKASTRKASAEANKASDGKLRMKMRIVALESRMTLLERQLMADDELRAADVELSMKHWEGHASSANAEEE